MIQRLATLLITLYISISLQAQDKKKPGFTKEEFRARQEAYLTQKAEITQEEATKFFPIYFELQDRKKTVNDKAEDLMMGAPGNVNKDQLRDVHIKIDIKK